MRSEKEIIAELRRLARVGEGLGHRYQAHLSLHQAAVIAGNAEELRQRRDDAHTVLDAILDNGEAIQQLIREAQLL